MVSADKVPSEFGGYPGEIQPEPHKLSPAERLRLAFRSNPSDADTNPEDTRVDYQAVEVADFEEGGGSG